MECRRFNEEKDLLHIMNKENIDICCIQETHLQKDKTFKARGYQCFGTDRGGDRRKGGIITLIKSTINPYMSSSSNDGEEQIHYHRFIVRFPMRLDFLFITFLLQECYEEYWNNF